MSVYASNQAPKSGESPSDPDGTSAPRRHLAVVRALGVDDAAEQPRRRWRIAVALSVALVVSVGIGLVVLPGDTRTSTPPADRPEPGTADTTEEEAATDPTSPVTENPAGPDPQTEPAGDPQTPQPSPETPPAPTVPASDAPQPGPAPQTPPGPQAPPPPTNPPPAPTPPAPATANGTVQGCNTYGEDCGNVPLYVDVPPSDYDYATFPKVATVANGTTLTARCWATGGVTYNYAAWYDPPDYGPDPYDSSVYFNVRAPNGQWAYVPDTYFVRDKTHRLGLDAC